MEELLEIWKQSFNPRTIYAAKSETYGSKPPPQPSWVWRTGSFAGEFGDAFIVNTNLEGGDVPGSIATLVDIIRPFINSSEICSKLLPLFSDNDIKLLENILNDFENAVSWGEKLYYSRGRPSVFLSFLTEWITALKNLEIGKRIIINGGWLVVTSGCDGNMRGRGHATIYIIERDNEDEYAFTVVNTGEGCEYHPTYFGDYPKQKRRSAIRIGKIPKQRIFDEGVWYLIYKMRYQCSSVHSPQLLYDVILPFFANENQSLDKILKFEANSYSFAENLDEEIRLDRCGDFETIQRSGTCFLRAILSAFRYCCKRVGFSIKQRKQLLYGVRISFLFRTYTDLQRLITLIENNTSKTLTDKNNNTDIVSKGSGSISDLVGGWQHSDVRMINMALDITALAAVKEAKRGSIGKQELFQIREFSNIIKKQVEILGQGAGAPRSINIKPLPEIKDNFGGYSAIIHPFNRADLLKVASEISDLYGNVLRDEQSSYLLMNNYTKIDNLQEFSVLLENTINLFDNIRNKSTIVSQSISMHQIVATTEYIFTHILPLPEPLIFSKDGSNFIQPSLFWSQSISYEEQHNILEYIHKISLHYISASYSLTQDRSIESARICINYVFLLCFDALLRIPLEKSSNPFSDVFTSLENKPYWLSVDGYEQKTSIKDAYATMILIRPEFTRAIQSVISYFYESEPVLDPNNVSFLFHWKADSKRLRSQFRIESEDPTLRFVNELLEKQNITQNKHPNDDVMLPSTEKTGKIVKKPKVEYKSEGDEKSIARLTSRVKWFCSDEWNNKYDIFKWLRNICFLSSLSLEPTKLFFLENQFMSKRQIFYPQQFIGSWRVKSVSSAFLLCGVTLCSISQFKIGIQRLHSPSYIEKYIPPISSSIPTKPHALALIFKGNPFKAKPLKQSGKSTDAKANRHVAEEDVFSTQQLPIFENVDPSDCEHLLSLLTAPYLSLPLVLGFFEDHRVSCLLEIELQNILESVLFEPREFTSKPLQINKVPVPPEDREESLGDKYSLLERELRWAPDTCLSLILSILKQVYKLCTGNYNSPFSLLMLYLTRITVRILRTRMAIEQLSNEKYTQSKILSNIFSWFERKLVPFIQRLQSQCIERQDLVLAVKYSVYQVLLLDILQLYYKNTEYMLSEYLWHLCFVIVWNSQSSKYVEPHSNMIMPEIKKSLVVSSTRVLTYGPLNSIPMNDIFLIIERNRKSIIENINKLKDSELQILLTKLSSVTSQSNNNSCSSYNNNGKWINVIENNNILRGIYCNSILGIEVNLQTMMVSFSKRLLIPTPNEIIENITFKNILSDAIDPYCVILSNTECCKTIQIIHDKYKYKIEAWTPLKKTYNSLDLNKNSPIGSPFPILKQNTLLYNNIIYNEYFIDNNKSNNWFFSQFNLLWKETLKQKLSLSAKIYTHPNILNILKNNNSKQYVIGLYYIKPRSFIMTHPGFYYEIVVLPNIKCFHVYILLEKGRRVGRSLIFSSHCKWSLHYLQPSVEDRLLPWYPGTEYAAGNIFDYVISSDGNHIPQIGFGNLSDIKFASLYIQRSKNNKINESYIHEELLYGIIPDALVETFEFWKNDNKSIIKGYFKKLSQVINNNNSVSYQNIKDWWNIDEKIIIEFDNNNRDSIIIRRKSSSTSMILLNPLLSSKDSELSCLVSQIIELESLSHVLIWSNSNGLSGDQVSIDLIEFPRLGIRFEVRKSPSGISRFYSVDHDDLYLSQSINPKHENQVQKYTESLLHGSVLQNENGQSFLLVPNDGLSSVFIRSCPFSTTIVSHRELVQWRKSGKTCAYYIYPIHPSGSFLMFSSIASALYMSLLRFLRRDYIETANYLSHCFPDCEFTDEEKWIISHVKDTLSDAHPDAHACRLHFALLCLEHSTGIIDWSVEEDLTSYLQKYSHVSADCRLTFAEERTLLEYYKESKDSQSSTKLRLTYLEHFEKAEQSGESIVFSIPHNMLYGGTRIKPLYIHANQAIKGQFSTRPCHLFFNYERPGFVDKNGKPSTISGLQALKLIDNIWDDNLYGQKHKAGFFLLYEMLMGRVDLNLLNINNDYEEDYEIENNINISSLSENDKNILKVNKTIEEQEGKRRKSTCFSLAKLLIYGLYFRFNVSGRGLPPDTSASFTILVITLAMIEADRDHKHIAWKLPYMPYNRLKPLMQQVRHSSRAELRQGFWGDRSNGEADEFEKTLTKVVMEYANNQAWKQQPMFLQPELESPVFYCATGNPNEVTVNGIWAPCRPHIDDISCNKRILAPFSVSQVVELPETQINLSSLNITEEDIKNFNGIPMNCININNYIINKEINDISSYKTGSDKDPLYQLNKQEYSNTTVAKQIIKRLNDDVSEFLKTTSKRNITCLKILNHDMIKILSTKLSKASYNDLRDVMDICKESLNNLLELKNELEDLQQNDSLCISSGVLAVEQLANQFPLEPTNYDLENDESLSLAANFGSSIVTAKLCFLFQREAKQQSWLRFDLLCRALMSPNPEQELKSYNPFLSKNRCSDTLLALSGILVRSVRLSQTNNCISSTIRLISSLKNISHKIISQIIPKNIPIPKWINNSLPIRSFIEIQSELSLNKSIDLWNNIIDTYIEIKKLITMKFNNYSQEHEQIIFVLLHYLNFNKEQCLLYINHNSENILKLYEHSSRFCWFNGKKTQYLHNNSDNEKEEKQYTSELHLIEHTADTLATLLMSPRCYSFPIDDKHYNVDPRFLVFEFVSNFLLRQRQIELINDFASSAKIQESSVHQMIMGAGKTTVICPLLALLLADGKSLVTQVVPASLLEMSRSVLRSCFSYVIHKKVISFEFDRYTAVDSPNLLADVNQLYLKLCIARKEKSLVCTTPEAIKSLMLMYLDLLSCVEGLYYDQVIKSKEIDKIEDEKFRQVEEEIVRETITQLQEKEAIADVIRNIILLWSKEQLGIALLDEVDTLLHPLRSELNFPIGPRVSLPGSYQRWQLPFHLFDSLFYSLNDNIGYSTLYQKPTEQMNKLWIQISELLEQGKSLLSLQLEPHLVLLQKQFYKTHLQEPLAKWAMIWLEEQPSLQEDFSKSSEYPTVSMALSYIQGLVYEKEKNFKDIMEKSFSPDSISLLNLSRDWICSLLPHCLSKINRVHYGLLQKHDIQQTLSQDNTFLGINTRNLLAVPFIGKDVPSQSSEFAHPDVLIGLTILAYRYEGLRSNDIRSLVLKLQEQLLVEVGPFTERPSHLLFQDWINAGSIDSSSSDDEDNEKSSSSLNNSLRLSSIYEIGQEVLPLEVFQVSDKTQLESAEKMLNTLHQVIFYYLDKIIFPCTMKQQEMKLQATGQDIGGNMLFGTRLGFSGTPSDVLPRVLRPCHFETGSEAHILHTLLSSTIKINQINGLWNVNTLLQYVANQQCQALIDAGALITGLNNEQVARKLLQLGLSHMDGCVFLDNKDRKMIIDRSNAPAIPLNRSGIPIRKRFTFYDQVHTTGMDIPQTVNACAFVTIGKDTTFRDYAQACWRMRGLGKGQSINVIVVPELSQLIKTMNFESSYFPTNMISWLLRNSIYSEHIQQIQLCQQDICISYRYAAFSELIHSSAPPKMQYSIIKLPETRFADNEIQTESQKKLASCIKVFREKLDHKRPTVIPILQTTASRSLQLVKERCKELLNNGIKLNEDLSSLKALEELEKEAIILDKFAKAKDFDSEVVQEQEQQQEKRVRVTNQFKGKYAKEKEPIMYWQVSSLIKSNISRHAIRANPLKSLSLYSMFQPGLKRRLEFPSNILITTNHSHPVHRSENQRRLKKVHVILVWIDPSNTLYSIIINLAEAEALRSYLFYSRKSSKVFSSNFGLYDIKGRELFPFSFPNSSFKDTFLTHLQCIRFWNCEFQYHTKDLLLLLTALSNSPLSERSSFWKLLLLCHKKDDYGWEHNTLSYLFTHKHAKELLDIRETALLLKRAILSQYSTLVAAFQAIDTDNDGLLSKDDIFQFLSENNSDNNNIDISQLNLDNFIKHAQNTETTKSDQLMINLRQFVSLIHVVEDLD